VAFLTIAGTEYEVLTTSATRRAPERGGARVRAFAGNTRSTARYEKRVWAFTLRDMPLATFETLVAAVALDAVVACAGDAIGAAAVNCIVDIGETQYVDNAGVTFAMRPTVTLTEV
jgi:hypothetical protein